MAGSGTENNIMAIYNYKSFSRSESAGKSSEFKNSLRAGDAAPDFDLPTIEGERVRLSALRGKKHVLLEFGSIT
jgi:peroxiredoxin